MELTRRKILAIGSGTLALAGLPGLPAFANPAQEAIALLTGGAEIGEGGVTLTLPEMAADGGTVPLEVSAPGAVSIAIFAERNPEPGVVTFTFGPLSGSRSVSTRIRLAETQEVTALATMEDGSFQMAKAHVDVTVGGCG
ncbi:thiosulfate oxidation carrier protein SoxY [Oceanibium sediminis]|uniref:thiosulfate oxidation carrier protein SoxY n=1 Tax=Oceanibium sediminis TaxID=2026339 RepID=UPI000DD42E14|nr:thiosulfate oxidation carrier protein SoxY [Oceanibium sediminis]